MGIVYVVVRAWIAALGAGPVLEIMHAELMTLGAGAGCVAVFVRALVAAIGAFSVFIISVIAARGQNVGSGDFAAAHTDRLDLAVLRACGLRALLEDGVPERLADVALVHAYRVLREMRRLEDDMASRIGGGDGLERLAVDAIDDERGEVVARFGRIGETHGRLAAAEGRDGAAAFDRVMA